jgi:ABC-type lipoprotein release transport system permease subunit
MTLPTFWKIAFRNIARKKRRTLLTVSAVSLGLAALIFIWGYVDGMNQQMIDNATGYFTGDLQVQAKGFQQSRDPELAIWEPGPVVRLLRQTDGVEAVTARVELPALLGVGENSSGALLVGVDPDTETAVTRIHEAISLGRYLRGSDGEVIVLGDELASRLKVSVNDTVLVLVQTAYGSIGAGLFEVVGIIRTGTKTVDATLAFVPLATAQDLYALDSGVTGLVARLADKKGSRLLADRLAQKLDSETLQVLDWRELLPDLVSMVAFHDSFTYVVMIIVFTVVAIGVTNTILMAVVERTREFGILMALGMRPLQVVRLVLYESLILGLVGVVLGGALGLLVTLYFKRVGLDFSAYIAAVQTMAGLTAVVYPMIDSAHLSFSVGLVLAFSVLASIYPASRAARLDPVVAIRTEGLTTGIARKVKLRFPRLGLQFLNGQLLVARMAWRNIGRNTRRTLITASALALSMAALLFVYALAEGFYDQMINNSTDYLTGHLQVSAPGFEQEMVPTRVIDRPEDVASVLKALPGVKGVSPRVETRVLLSSAARSVTAVLVGIDPRTEPSVTRLAEVVTDGDYLQPDGGYEVIIGAKLAERLDVGVGEKVIVLAQGFGGEMTSAALRVRGIFRVGSEAMDGVYAFAPLGTVQALYDLGESVSLFAVSLQDLQELPAVVSELRSRLDPSSYEVRTWDQIMPVVVQMVEFVDVEIYVLLLIIFAIVALGVLNTVLMSVLERTREFGVLISLGTKGSQLIKLVLFEAAFLGVIGLLLGTGLGALLISYYNHHGIDFSTFAASMKDIPGALAVVFPAFKWENLVWPWIVLLIVCIAASLYPAIKAARLEPAEALRHVG